MIAPAQIPATALADCIAIIGKRGSGKSATARHLAEAELAAGHRLCVLDPKGDWWGLRLTADGKPSPWPVAIFGGEKADVPIEDHMGADIARLVAGNNLPCMIDLSAMSVAGQRRFATAFAETLFDLNRAALTLIVDEADQLAPKHSGAEKGSNIPMLVHRMARLVKMGRNHGIFMWMITQRPAVLHNDLLSQAQTMVAMRLTLKADRDAAKGWFDTHSPDAIKAVMDSLPGLNIGEGWVCAGTDMLARVQFPMFTSFDSSRTPQHGESPLSAVTLGSIDLSAIRAALAAPIVADAPAKGKKAPPVMDNAAIDALRAQLAEAEASVTYWRDLAHQHGRTILAAKAALAGDVQPEPATATPVSLPERRSRPIMMRRVGEQARPMTPVDAAIAATKIGPERKPLAVLAGFAPAGLSEAAWATLAGFKRSGGTWSTYRGRLRAASYVDQRDGLFHATAAGIHAAGDEAPDVPPPGRALVAFWAARVPGAGRMLQHLATTFPEFITRERLGADLGISTAGGTFGTYLGRLRSNGLIEEQGYLVRIATAIMGETA